MRKLLVAAALVATFGLARAGDGAPATERSGAVTPEAAADASRDALRAKREKAGEPAARDAGAASKGGRTPAPPSRAPEPPPPAAEPEKPCEPVKPCAIDG